MRGNEGSIPDLFPNRLVDIATERVLGLIRLAGQRVSLASQTSQSRYGVGWYDYQLTNSFTNSIVSRAWPDWLAATPNQTHFTSSRVFLENAQICREFLSLFLAGSVLDFLSQQARQETFPESPENIFTFTVLCGDRLSRLVVHQHSELDNCGSKGWAGFISSPQGQPLILSCLSQLHSLSSLYLHYVATNDMLYVVSTVCTRLVILDISYSSQVTDIGLVHLCGVLKGSPGCVDVGPRGCKYLRELYFNPPSEHCQELIMPKVTACLLRHLPRLQVMDLSNLHAGIEHYYKGSRESSHRQSRVKALNLVHYTGSDQLADVMHVCPKLRTFKLFVTDELPQLGYTLKGLNHQLDQVTLVYNGWSVTPPAEAPAAADPADQLADDDLDHNQVEPPGLAGFQEFLANCGNKISRLEVDSSKETVITVPDLMAISAHCPNIECIAFSNFHVVANADRRIGNSGVPLKPASFPFLNQARLNNVSIDEYGKDVFRYMLGGASDLELVNISFRTPGYFFSDFLLDDILVGNDLAHLQTFVLRGGALTLISALRLISGRPKLRTIGSLLDWDVEASELETFIQILRRARSLNLLQDIHIY